MRYNQNQVAAVSEELRIRFEKKEATGTEIVVALISMHKAGRIDSADLKQILLHVYSRNVKGIIQALHQAGQVIDPQMIDEIVREVEQGH